MPDLKYLRADIAALPLRGIARLDHYARGHDIVMEVLGGYPGVMLSEPEGAFYVFPKLEGIDSNLDFALGLLEAQDVGVAPGYTFGEHNEQHIRICFARSHDQLREGLRRMLRYLDRWRTGTKQRGAYLSASVLRVNDVQALLVLQVEAHARRAGGCRNPGTTNGVTPG